MCSRPFRVVSTPSALLTCVLGHLGWYLLPQHCPHMLYPASEVSSMLPLEQFQCCLTEEQWLVSSCEVGYWLCLFLYLSAPGDQLCGVLGFVASGSAACSSELRSFEVQLVNGVLPPPICLLTHLSCVREVHHRVTGVLGDEGRTFLPASVAFPFHTCSKTAESVRVMHA